MGHFLREEESRREMDCGDHGGPEYAISLHNIVSSG